jgi:putative ribosome biogenesis GTPase RsgA
LDYQEQLKSVSPKAETVILANKADLVPSLEEAESEIAGMAGQIGSPYFLTSAKSGVNVDAGFQALARRLINGKR